MVKKAIVIIAVVVLGACTAQDPKPVCNNDTPPACLIPPITVKP